MSVRAFLEMWLVAWLAACAASISLTAVAVVITDAVRARRAAKRRKPPKMIVLNGGRR